MPEAPCIGFGDTKSLGLSSSQNVGNGHVFISRIISRFSLHESKEQRIKKGAVVVMLYQRQKYVNYSSRASTDSSILFSPLSSHSADRQSVHTGTGE